MSKIGFQAGDAGGQTLNGGPASHPLIASLARLVPYSGIQFIDISIPTRTLAATLAKFVEDADPVDGTMLIQLSQSPDAYGVEWHPVTQEPLAPNQSLWLNGFQALEPFAGRWLPLPYLRFLGRSEDGQARYDKGPVNWVRLYIDEPAEGLRQAEVVQAVLAIDTQLDGKSRVDQDDYLAPNVDDITFGPVFRLAAEPAHLGDFLGGVWFDTWLSQTFAQFRQRQPVQSADATAGAPEPFTLEHVARYLTLLKVLDQHAQMPQLQFLDMRTPHWRARTSNVDLILDIDSKDTAATIVGRNAKAAGGWPVSEVLKMRDLLRPTHVHHGPFQSATEFATPNFGDAQASRLSGRLDAFNWPSLVRIGEEGTRLAMSSTASPGHTGEGDVLRGLNDTKPHDQVWRFSRGDAEGHEPGGMITGNLLSHIAEDGQVIGEHAGDLAPALRPHFSPSSLVSMFIAECLLHSMAQINAPEDLAAQGEVRTLQRVIVTCPLTATPEERTRLLDRVEDAVELVWKANGWDESETGLAPARPQVSLGLDQGASSQIMYLYDEIRIRSAGHARQCMRRLAAPRDRIGESEHVRIASLDVSGRATSLAVVDYAMGSEGAVHPSLEIADRTLIAGDSLIQAIIKTNVVPAIAAALDRAGHPDGAGLLARVMGLNSDGALQDRHFSARFLRKILVPAATALLDVYQSISVSAADAGVRRATLANLVRLGGGRMAPLDAQLEAVALREGAREFQLALAVVAVKPRALARTIRDHFETVVARVTEGVRQSNADIVVLSGQPGALADIGDMLLERLPLAPHRVVSLPERWDGMAESRAAAGFAEVSSRFRALLATSLVGGMGGSARDRIGHVAEQLMRALPTEPPVGLAALAQRVHNELPSLTAAPAVPRIESAVRTPAGPADAAEPLSGGAA